MDWKKTENHQSERPSQYDPQSHDDGRCHLHCVAMRNSVGLGSSKTIAVGNRGPESKESS
jgi:hypothetical protein